MKRMRRTLIAAGVAGIMGLLTAAPVLAASYPDRPVKIIVGLAPGGGTDNLARLVAKELSTLWKQSVVVENRTGASGTIGAETVTKALPDGYTLLISPQTSIAVAPQLFAKAPYDARKDLTPITVIASSPLVLVTHPSFPASNFKEFIAYARSNPDKVTFASGGVGSSPHMTSELLKAQFGIAGVHVPYRGEQPALTDVAGGQVSVLFANIPSGMPHVETGRLKALVTTGAKRSELAPNVPTISESGQGEIVTATWNAIYGPAGMAPELVQKIYNDVSTVMKKKEIAERLIASGNEPVLNSPEQFAEFLRSEYDRWGSVIKANNLQAQ
ncbi:tripartite tricarboxylate transporter substrate binding protein [Candidimonas sp. SYP-B2681]|uniref:Bug family tripartite tricarboxylate transporter substrate binding protein n=1 Tax=Candidimonas sp. SYP-B2681 TaxID=2497686 RepID=UPI000F8783F3|nr:tripartite tricarboxylate transporter substrate binding protein [Candidimonas sp. SYP-B2681]RTZ47841.1 tripartite tricarboxylate transporter substrate binding protein [Candidimonas sp. SYP-B2681]